MEKICVTVDKEKVQEVKKELNDFRENKLYTIEKQEDLEETRELLTKVTAVLDQNKTSGGNHNPDKFTNKISKLNDIEEELVKSVEKLLLQKFIIDSKIDKLKFPYRDILFMRYSRAQSWREIANKLKYDSDDYIYKLHGIALQLYAQL